MNNIIFSELILLVCIFLILSVMIIYQNYQIKKIKCRIKNSNENAKNYEYILSKILNIKN